MSDSDLLSIIGRSFSARSDIVTNTARAPLQCTLVELARDGGGVDLAGLASATELLASRCDSHSLDDPRPGLVGEKIE